MNSVLQNDGRLPPCPRSPNCVSTQADNPRQWIAPIEFTGPAEEARQRLLDIVRSLPRTKIVTAGERYLHAEFASRLFRFIDDVEFLIDDDARVIHFRSASRVGYSDFGVNRRRMEEIRRRFAARG